MPLLRPSALAVPAVLFTLVTAPSAVSQSADAETAQLWADYNHYVRIARPDLAAASAQKLLNTADDAQLLGVVEAGNYHDFESRTFEVARKIETLKKVTHRLRTRIEAGRIAKSRDRDRIAQNIALLAGTARQNRNAIERLRAAGQFAAPQLLHVLNDEKQASLVPHVEIAMVALGRPLVYPLSEALSRLEAVQLGQVARVLAKTGYPRALPYLKQMLENPDVDPEAARIVQTAYDRLASSARTPHDVSAAELFLTVGRNAYDAGTRGKPLPGLDTVNSAGIVWTYLPRSGLVPVPVPAAIFPDVVAMRAARRALKLDGTMDPALSLWLAANLRRENRLPEGQDDPSHSMPREPMYYALMAGPLRLHDVLDRALRDGDSELALDAIEALWASAGTEALINRDGAMQPLLRAISYPDRRVRFEAGFVMTQTKPTGEFPGSNRVVSVLAEAVRQSDLRHALAVARDQEALNGLLTVLKDVGYEVIGGLTLDEVADTVNAGPGIDVIVTNLAANQVSWVIRGSARSQKLASAAVLAIVSTTDQAALKAEFRNDSRVHFSQATDATALEAAVSQAAQSMVGVPIGAEEAAGFATRALRLLREVAQGASPVYNVTDAEGTLIEALRDEREQIVKLAARVLELIGSQEAQLAIGEAALDQTRSESVRIAMLNSLAESAKHFGSKLGQIQIDGILELVKTTDDDIALAAGRAHGALTLPTSNAVELIKEGE